MRQRSTLSAVLVAALLVLTGEASAASEIRPVFALPVEFAAMIQATDCNASPGPRLTLGGELTPAALDIEVVFSHVMGAGDPQAGTSVRRAVVPAETPTPVLQQSIVGALGNNPYVWLQITDQHGRPLTSETFLGRCDEGLFTPTIAIPAAAQAIAEVSATDCDASFGPVISFVGQVEVSALNGRLIFRSSDATGGPGPKPAEAAIELVILPSGAAFPLPQENLLAETGGNPLVSARFQLEDGTAVTPEARLGRCSAIANQD